MLDLIMQQTPILILMSAALGLLILAGVLTILAAIPHPQPTTTVEEPETPAPVQIVPVSVAPKPAAPPPPPSAATPEQEEPEASPEMLDLINSVFSDEEAMARYEILLKGVAPVDVHELADLTNQIYQQLSRAS